MFSLIKQAKAARSKASGFTIVELLIVIVVIGILATLVIVTFAGIQQKGRDSQRKTDINAVQSHVESYYAQNGYYPSAANLNDATWRATNTKGLDPAALSDPKNTTDTLQTAAQAAGTYKYWYLVTQDDGSACAADTCTKYTLSAHMEKEADYVKSSN